MDDNKIEAVKFLDRTSEKIAGLLVNINEKFTGDLKQRLQEVFGKEFG